MQDVIPDDDVWKFAVAAITAATGGVASLFSWLTTREGKRVDALAASWESRIAAAERREAESRQERRDDRESFTKRQDMAIEAINRGVATTTEQSLLIKQFAESFRQFSDAQHVTHDELRKIHGRIDLLIHENNRRRPDGA